MGLADLSDQAAVLAAMAECDTLGRDAFLAKYGFGEARTYFLEFDGKRYDSKAIAGVSHKHQFGAALKASEFSGGDKTVAAKLSSLGFIVTRPASSWTIPIGRVTTKTDIHDEFGGAIYGGIGPSASTPNVMIYSDPAVGAEYGYQYDGWADDEPGVFFYTGEGQVGDQSLAGGNKAILDHANDGRTLRLFFTVPGTADPGGKLRRYIGAFRLDPNAPYEWRQAPDNGGDIRKVVVFRLVPDEVDDYPSDPIAQPEVSLAGRSRSKLAHQHSLCPIHFLELSVTGECDLCG